MTMTCVCKLWKRVGVRWTNRYSEKFILITDSLHFLPKHLPFLATLTSKQWAQIIMDEVQLHIICTAGYYIITDDS